MANEQKPKRITKVAKECNVATSTIMDFLKENNLQEKPTPNTKVSQEVYEQLLEKYQPDKLDKEKSQDVVLPGSKKAGKSDSDESEKDVKEETEEFTEKKKNEAEETSPPTSRPQVKGPKIVDKINLDEKEVSEETSDTSEDQVEDDTHKEDEKAEPAKEEQVTSTEDTIEEDVAEQEEKKEEIKSEEEITEESEPEKEATESEDHGDVSKESEQKIQEPETESSESDSVEEPATQAKEETQKDKPSEKAESEDEKEKPAEEEASSTRTGKDYDTKGLTVVGKIDLGQFDKGKKKEPVASTSDPHTYKKKRRKRKKIEKEDQEKGTQKEQEKEGQESKKTEQKQTKPEDRKQPQQGKKKRDTKKKKVQKEEIDDKKIDEKIKQTLTKLEGGSGTSRSKLRRQKRDEKRENQPEEEGKENVLEVTEFITANELASLMNKSVTEVISACMSLGLMVSINQRLDAETITLVADEFGYDVEFKEAKVEEPDLEDEDNEEEMVARSPIVTIMGHVDHGKTSLLDYIQKSKIIAGESGGITQHIGAYEVDIGDGRTITYLDTPGHEAFTAMRARGAQVTDVAIIVIAADDSIKPQTKEAISHAQAAEVPIVFAINKIDKPEANPEKVKEELAGMNILVEDWGGKYQVQEISAKQGEKVDELQEKVLLEAEIQELKADPTKNATGTVIEATKTKGKGIVTSILVQKGTLYVGDIVLAGAYNGRVRAIMNERGQRIEQAGPSKPVQILGMDGTPQAGDKFYVLDEERKARDIATERQQLLREQGRRAKKHITLDEIGRRLAIGNFQELNVIIKGDFEGSVEALADSLQKLSTNEVQVNVIHKGVGQITESDVLLASASDAIIVGFQVRPSSQARKVAAHEQIDVRIHSVIYDAIEEVKSALEGMLSPKIEEKIIGHAEVRDVFKISKVGSVAGCKVTDGKIRRNAKVRLIREGVVIYNSTIDTLKRYKENTKEVFVGYECGLTISNFNDIKVGDEIECYEEVEVKRTLEEKEKEDSN